MRIALCDSSEEWLDQEKEIISRCAAESGHDLEILVFSHGRDLLAADGEDLMAVFLEIDLEGEDGLEIASRINQRWGKCAVIYCTDSRGHVLEINSTRYLDFLLKDQFEARIEMILNRLFYRDKIKDCTVEYYLQDGEIRTFPVKDIIYFERETRFTKLVTTEGEYRINERITMVMDRLPEGLFSRCSSSYTVNLWYISEKRGNAYKLRTGGSVPISKAFSRSTLQDYSNWRERWK